MHNSARRTVVLLVIFAVSTTAAVANLQIGLISVGQYEARAIENGSRDLQIREASAIGDGTVTLVIYDDQAEKESRLTFEPGHPSYDAALKIAELDELDASTLALLATPKPIFGNDEAKAENWLIIRCFNSTDCLPAPREGYNENPLAWSELTRTSHAGAVRLAGGTYRVVLARTHEHSICLDLRGTSRGNETGIYFDAGHPSYKLAETICQTVSGSTKPIYVYLSMEDYFMPRIDISWDDFPRSSAWLTLKEVKYPQTEFYSFP